MNQSEIFIIGNSYHNVSYASAMIGFGYQVSEMRTFNAARALIKAGVIPQTIVINMKGQPLQVREFIDLVRAELYGEPIGIIVIGGSDREMNVAYTHGADVCLQRPVNTEALVEVVRSQLVA